MTFGVIDLAAILIAFALAAIVKGAIGVGTPLIAVPLLSTRLGLPETITLLTIPLVVGNCWHVWEYRSARRDLRFLPSFLICAGAGVGIGTWGLVSLDPAPLRVGIGIMVLIYLATTLALPNLTLSHIAGRKLAPLVGAGSGILQGMTGISAPISLTYLSALQLTRPQFILSASSVFLTFALIQSVTLSLAGIMTLKLLALSAMAAGVMPVFLPLGGVLGRRISPKVFRQIVLALLLVLAVRMIHQGISL